MKPLVKARIPFNEMVALADTLLAKPPEFFEPFLGPCANQTSMRSPPSWINRSRNA
jgi:hypothetical protein